MTPRLRVGLIYSEGRRAHLLTTSSSQAPYPSPLRFCVGAHSFRAKMRLFLRKHKRSVIYDREVRAARNNASFSSSSPKLGRFGDPFGGGSILTAVQDRRSPRVKSAQCRERNPKMPINHLEAKIISRGTGRSAVAASAYMSCSKILNDYDGVQHDYTRKQGLVREQVFLHENAPAEWKDRSVLWNAALKKPRKPETVALPASSWLRDH